MYQMYQILKFWLNFRGLFEFYSRIAKKKTYILHFEIHLCVFNWVSSCFLIDWILRKKNTECHCVLKFHLWCSGSCRNERILKHEIKSFSCKFQIASWIINSSSSNNDKIIWIKTWSWLFRDTEILSKFMDYYKTI